MNRRGNERDLEAELASRERPTSFPFISGDTFRSFCDVVVDECGVSGTTWLRGQKIFCATKYAHDLTGIVEKNQQLKSIAKEMTVLLHNGDQIPNASLFAQLLEYFAHVYTVNVTPELERMGVGALPIGIENLHWNGNGLLTYFPYPARVNQLIPWYERRNLVFGSFRTHTNPGVREPLQGLFRRAGMTWHSPDGNTQSYFNGMRDSIFVVSPQGNGLDCHRTWEALYSGCIPVVTQGTLSRTITNDLPFLIVDSWEAFSYMTMSDLMGQAEGLSTRSRQSAYLGYWLTRLGARPAP